MKYSFSFLLFILAAVCALLGLEWFETHGAPVLIPPKDILFAIVLVSPLTTILYTVSRCRPRRKTGAVTD